MSEFVIMPKADYEAACNSIRAKTGKTELIKSGAMSTEIDSITGGGSSDDVRYVTFMSYDGTTEYGKKAVAVGDDCADPIERGVFDTPTKESTAQYDYSFYGWATMPNGAADANWNKAVTEDRTVYANFAAVVRYYTITYLDTDGSVLKTESLAYGSMPSYEPKKNGHTFGGWQPAPVPVTGDASYTATWNALAAFGSASWAEIVSIVESGQAQNYFNVGDERIVTYNGSDLTLQIIGFDHDELSDGSGKAGMTIWTKNVVEARVFNFGDATTKGYGSSVIANHVNSNCLNRLPAEIVESIKTVKKYYFNGNTSGTIGLTSNTYKAWLLSVTEIGAEDYAYIHNSVPYAEGARYSFFDGTNAPRSKGASWWTRSVKKAGINGTYAYVAADGSMNAVGGSSGTHGVVFGFCI